MRLISDGFQVRSLRIIDRRSVNLIITTIANKCQSKTKQGNAMQRMAKKSKANSIGFRIRGTGERMLGTTVNYLGESNVTRQNNAQNLIKGRRLN